MKHHHFTTIPTVFIAFIGLLVHSPFARAQGEQPEQTLTIELIEQDDFGEHLLLATVTVDDEPVEDVTVTFSIIRTFGAIVLGSEITFDDGTAAVEFPLDIPGNASGHFTVVASIEGDDQFLPASTTSMFSSNVPPADQNIDPASLWSQRPFWPLVAVLGLLLAGVWGTYVFVIIQLFKLSSS